MTEKPSALGREVERLITAPYAPSLQDLHGLVQPICTASLQTWASHKPCQVGALVDVLVDGLSRSNFALNLLGSFARVEDVRNAILERYPYILDQFLRKSLEDGQVEYVPSCVAMLSSPLPPNFIVPACLAPFIMNLIHSVGENPCAETVLPLYQLMTGLKTTPRVLFEIPPDTMLSLQVELTKTLRNLDDHMGNLLCLATFAQIASSRSGDEHGQYLPSWLQNIKYFFGPKRGLKTLDLVVLRAILSCSSSCSNLTTDQAAESIRLAIEICDTVEREQREQWIGANSSKIAKLCEKVTRTGINHEVQILGATFLVSLLPASSLSPSIPALAVHWLLTETRKNVLEVLPLKYIPRLVVANTICSGRSAVSSFLDYAFSAVGHAANVASIATSQIAKSIILGLQSLDSQTFCSTVAEVADKQCSGIVNDLIEGFPRSTSQQNCQGSGTCYAEHTKLDNELLYELFTFYLRVSLSRNTERGGTHLEEVNTFRMIISKAGKLTPLQKCRISETKPLDLRDRFSAPKVHASSPSSRLDWRAGMADTLMLNARMSHEGMMQKVEEICYDLEQRCGGVEAPLRAVEEERDKISLEAKELKRQNEELQAQLSQASGTISGLHNDVSRLGTTAETASTRVEELSANLSAVQKALEEQRLDSQESANNEREQARTRELDLMASLTEKDDRLEGLQEEVREQLEENGRLRDIIDTVSKEKAAALEHTESLSRNSYFLEREVGNLTGEVADRQEEISDLQDEALNLREEISKLQKDGEEQRALLGHKDEEIQQHMAAKEDMATREEVLKNKLNEELLESDRLKVNLHKSEESFMADMETLREYSELQISKLKSECAHQKEEIASLQSGLQVAATSSNKELQTKEKRIQYLEKKVQHMRDERSSKAREFSEAQQHIGRLMSVMGFKADPVKPKHSSKQQRPRSLDPSQVAPTEQQTHESTQTQHDEIPEASFESDTSSFGERSPKRPRDNAFSHTESSAPSQKSDKRSRESVSRSGTTQRTTLADADHNSQPSSQKSHMSHPSQCQSSQESQLCGKVDENRLQDIDLDMDLEFSKDFIFTSTSLSEVNDHVPPSGAQR